MEQATATPTHAAPPRSAHGEAWGALARTHAAIYGRLQEASAAADFPPLPWYEVLATVSEAPEQRMKMGDLAEALVITRGGLTKLVDRLIKAGLLERTFCETDRRVSYATLMPGRPRAARGNAPGRRRRAEKSPSPQSSAPPRPTRSREALGLRSSGVSACGG